MGIERSVLPNVTNFFANIMNFLKMAYYNSLGKALYLSGEKDLKFLANLVGVNSKTPREVKENRNILHE